MKGEVVIFWMIFYCYASSFAYDHLCLKQYNGFLRHPKDCHKFIRCSHQRAYIFNCPASLLWHHEIESCDFSYRTRCTITKESEILSQNQLPGLKTKFLSTAPKCRKTNCKNSKEVNVKQENKAIEREINIQFLNKNSTKMPEENSIKHNTEAMLTTLQETYNRDIFAQENSKTLKANNSAEDSTTLPKLNIEHFKIIEDISVTTTEKESENNREFISDYSNPQSSTESIRTMCYEQMTTVSQSSEEISSVAHTNEEYINLKQSLKNSSSSSNFNENVILLVGKDTMFAYPTETLKAIFNSSLDALLDEVTQGKTVNDLIVFEKFSGSTESNKRVLVVKIESLTSFTESYADSVNKTVNISAKIREEELNSFTETIDNFLSPKSSSGESQTTLDFQDFKNTSESKLSSVIETERIKSPANPVAGSLNAIENPNTYSSKDILTNEIRNVTAAEFVVQTTYNAKISPTEDNPNLFEAKGITEELLTKLIVPTTEANTVLQENITKKILTDSALPLKETKITTSQTFLEKKENWREFTATVAPTNSYYQYVTDNTTQDPRLPFRSIECQGENNRRQLKANKCYQYYQCFAGWAFLLNCPDGLIFQPKEGQCTLDVNEDCEY